MDVRYLEYILEIANQRSISRAKDRLFVSQSTLSQYLIRLEQELGTPLFYRGKNELTPTTAGQLYIEAARNVVEIRRNLYERIASLKDIGNLKIAVSSDWGMKMMAQLAPQFHSSYPGITLEITQDRFASIKQDLLDGRLDLAVTAVSGPTSLEYERLCKEEIVLAVHRNHPAAALGLLTTQSFRSYLADTPLICSQPGSTIQELTASWLENTGTVPPVACVVNNNQAALTMISQGMGMAFVPRGYVDQYEAVTPLSLNPSIEREDLLMIRHNLEIGPVEEYLLELIRTYPLFH